MTDPEINLLLCVRDRKRIVDIETVIGASRAIVQRRLAAMEAFEYIKRETLPGGRKAKHRGRILTEKGKEILKTHGHSTQPNPQ